MSLHSERAIPGVYAEGVLSLEGLPTAVGAQERPFIRMNTDVPPEVKFSLEGFVAVWAAELGQLLTEIVVEAQRGEGYGTREGFHL